MIEETIIPKGTKYVLEIELTKDMPSVYNPILESIYGQKEIEGLFKVEVLHFKSMEEIKKGWIDKIIHAANSIF